MKKSALFPMHSLGALVQAYREYMKRQCAQTGASSLTCRSVFEIVVVFLVNDLLALMLNQMMRSWGGIRRFAEGIP